MSDTSLRHCCVCKQKYKFCPKCPEYQYLEPWYFSFCSENCRNIYDVTSKYENGQITDANAKERIQTINLSKIENFGDSYKTTIAKIMNVVNERKAIEKTKEPIKIANEEKVKKSNETSPGDSVTDERIIKKSRKK